MPQGGPPYQVWQTTTLGKQTIKKNKNTRNKLKVGFNIQQTVLYNIRMGIMEEDDDPQSAGIDVTVGGPLKLQDLGLRMLPGGNPELADNEVDVDDFEIKLEIKKIKKVKRARANKKLRLFASCSSNRRLKDIDLCSVEICLVITIFFLLFQVTFVLLDFPIFP